MKRPRILHIAPTNISGVPGQLVQTEKQLGFDSRLVTLFRDKRNYFEDICLNLPFIDFFGTKWIKKFVSSPEKCRVTNTIKVPEKIPVEWRPHNIFEHYLVNFRDFIWNDKIENAIQKYHLKEYDVLQLDGGLGFYRNSGFVIEQKKDGKKIICCYTGSDLRTRGVIPSIDKISDLNVSVEFDHLKLHPNIHHVFFPFDCGPIKKQEQTDHSRIRIGHAPTNRQAKGSDVILQVLNELYSYNIEIVLIENLPYEKALELKRTCDIFIDQIGDLGYGINSLESLAMGIPTCSCLAPGFKAHYPDHPFVVINAENLKEQVTELILNKDLRRELSAKGREWVEHNHSAVRTVEKIHRLAGIV